MTPVASTLDPAFVSAFRAGTLTQAQAEAAMPRDHLAATFLLLRLSAAMAGKAGTPASGAHTPSGSIPPYAKPASKRRKKKPGGQPGHAGTSRPLPQRIDGRESHALPGRPGKEGKPADYKQAKTPLALYDLEADVAEKTNVAEKHPEVAERLRKLADGMRADLGDSLAKTAGKVE
jgi:hypothetical protein